MPPDDSDRPGVYELPPTAPDEPASRPQRRAVYAPLPTSVLAHNAAWFCHLRTVVVVLLLAFGIFGLIHGLLQRIGLKCCSTWAFGIAGVLAVYNIGFLLHNRHVRRSSQSGGVAANLWAQILLDLLVLTAVIHFLGSLETHAAFAYLFHVVLACIFFTPRQSLAVTVAACLFYLARILAERAGVLAPAGIFLDRSLQAGFETQPGRTLFSVGSLWAILVGVWYLTSHLSAMVRRRDRQLMETNTLLIAAQAERTRHMLHAAHELKSPCAAVLTNAELLLQGYCGDLPEQAQDVVSRMAVRCRRLTRQIVDMLQLANLQSEGQAQPKRLRVALDETLRSCLEQIGPIAEQKGIAVEADLQPAETFCAEDHLKMLFLNLLSNAVSYSNHGGRISVQCRRGPNDRAQVTIADEGIGIPQEKLPSIFDEYYRTAEAAEHNRGSSGLGLAIVRQVAQRNGIGVRVESRVGKGTRFVLRLPTAHNVRNNPTEPSKETEDG